MMEALLLLIIFDRFNLISGFKINWSKSALMPLNDVRPENIEDLRIPLVGQIKYLGIEFFPSSALTAQYNFDLIRGRIEGDLSRWATTHNSFQSRVSIIKMNILPRVNYVSSMLPLPPPKQHWTNINKAMSTFLWKNKRARVKLGTLQRRALSGGWGIPNFERYHHASILRALHVWFNRDAGVAWRPIEAANVSPHRLQDLVFF